MDDLFIADINSSVGQIAKKAALRKKDGFQISEIQNLFFVYFFVPVDSAGAQFFFNTKQLVVFRHTVGAA